MWIVGKPFYTQPVPPFFSVVIPSYNRARMLRTALRSVLEQTLRDWECWVVDDGSTDETQKALQEFSTDPRFKTLRNPENLGMNASRNLALDRAQGRFATFLDSDDLWLPGRLEAFKLRLERSPEAGFVFSNAYLFRFGRIVGTLFEPERPIPEGHVPGHYAIGAGRLPYVTTNVSIRRDAFDRWGGFRTEMRTLDTELYARFLAKGLEVAAIHEPLAVRRLHGEQLTDRYRENFSEAMQALAASGAGPEDAARLRREVACDVALYLVKAGRPGEARAFLEETLGGEALGTAAWRLGSVPPVLLGLARILKRLYLGLRHHPALAGGAARDVLRWLEPRLKAEESDDP